MAQIVRAIGEHADSTMVEIPLPANERQARALSPLKAEPARMAEAWQEAVDEADGQPTARQVAAAPNHLACAAVGSRRLSIWRVAMNRAAGVRASGALLPRVALAVALMVGLGACGGSKAKPAVPTTSGVIATTLVPTTLVPTTLVPTTLVPTTLVPGGSTTVPKASTVPKTSAATTTTIQTAVVKGRFCTPVGAVGQTTSGQTLTCRVAPGNSQAQWG